MIITSKTPHLDLHGEITSMVEVLVNEFINDNYKMRHRYLVIVHGKSTNVLTEEVHKVLAKNSKVKQYVLNNWNLGETLIELNFDK